MNNIIPIQDIIKNVNRSTTPSPKRALARVLERGPIRVNLDWYEPFTGDELYYLEMFLKA